MTGAVKVVGAVLLLVPSTGYLGGMLLAVTMVGGAATPLQLIGGNAVPAIVLGLLAAFVASRLRPSSNPATKR